MKYEQAATLIHEKLCSELVNESKNNEHFTDMAKQIIGAINVIEKLYPHTK